MNSITVYEFDVLTAEQSGRSTPEGLRGIPPRVFDWLQARCLKLAASDQSGWARLTQRHGWRAVQLTSFVGVIRAPGGFQIEVLPKIGKAMDGSDQPCRQLLIEMLCCLSGFRHLQTDSAKLAATRMPLLEIFIGEFLRAARDVVKRGIRSDYSPRHDTLFALRGKLLVSANLRQNLCRADRFVTEHDEFSVDRPENRLLHTALRWALAFTASQANQQLARELCLAFADIPQSDQVDRDLRQIRLDRGMEYYSEALAWARLILLATSPLTGKGEHHAPSLLFPMEAIFEAFVARYLSRQLLHPFVLRSQARSEALVRHRNQNWFRLQPDLLVRRGTTNRLVLDTKWKLLDSHKSNGVDKYGLSQADFYQLHAYGQSYLDGPGDVVLIYPRTDTFDSPLPKFEFPKSKGLRLWVLPFCLRQRVLILPADGELLDVLAPHLGISSGGDPPILPVS